jgi:hypothetical protein
VTIPSSVTSIGSEAFGATSSLRSITIPASVTSIGGEAFTNATNLSSIYFLGNAPTIIEFADTFANLPVSARAFIQPSATGFGAVGDLWNGLIVSYTPESPPAQSSQPSASLAATGANPMAGGLILWSALALATLGAGLLWKRRRLSN